MPKLRSLFNSGAMLVAFQLVGLAIPLLTLPFVARMLGVAEFGKVMLAQAIVFFGVVFVDAGFNTESQRRVALAKDKTQNMQTLFDNLYARSICALPVAAVLVAFSFLFNDVPRAYVMVAMLHIAGTLAFPQWWLIGNNMGLQMGLASTVGRLIAAGLTLALVRSPGDGLIAVAAASSGTLWAGLLVAPSIRARWKELQSALDRDSWRAYFSVVRPTIVSGFFSSASASTPPVILGWIAGISQVGFYTAADRLTRAAAHLVGVVEQTLMGSLARAEEQDEARGRVMRKQLLATLGGITGIGCLVVGYASADLVRLIYGEKFAPVALLLQLFCVWLWLFTMRRAGLLFTWSLRGELVYVSRFQWLETFSVTAFVTLGAYWGAAVGAVAALIASEIVLGLGLWYAVHKTRRPA